VKVILRALAKCLCGPDASYVHGQTINIDGGRMMM